MVSSKHPTAWEFQDYISPSRGNILVRLSSVNNVDNVDVDYVAIEAVTSFAWTSVSVLLMQPPRRKHWRLFRVLRYHQRRLPPPSDYKDNDTPHSRIRAS